MVESQKKLIERIKTIRKTSIKAETLEEDCIVMEMRRGWKTLTEEEKIEIAMPEAETKIMKWYKKKEEEGLTFKTFREWKQAIEKEPPNATILTGDKRRMNQPLSLYSG